MNYERFNEVLETTVSKCIDTLSIKSNEYATEDRLHNFKVAAIKTRVFSSAPFTGGNYKYCELSRYCCR